MLSKEPSNAFSDPQIITFFLLFVLLLYFGRCIVRKSPDFFSFLMSFGILAFIICQAVMNIAVVTAAVPTKGIPLPFISYGGSSLFLMMTGIGVLVNIADMSRREEPVPIPEDVSHSDDPAGIEI